MNQEYMLGTQHVSVGRRNSWGAEDVRCRLVSTWLVTDRMGLLSIWAHCQHSHLLMASSMEDQARSLTLFWSIIIRRYVWCYLIIAHGIPIVCASVWSLRLALAPRSVTGPEFQTAEHSLASIGGPFRVTQSSCERMSLSNCDWNCSSSFCVDCKVTFLMESPNRSDC